MEQKYNIWFYPLLLMGFVIIFIICCKKDGNNNNINKNGIIVTTSNDSIKGSLRDAINKAQSGDEITFDKSLTEINLGGQINIDKSITISGNPNLLLHDVKLYNKSTQHYLVIQHIFEISGSEPIVVNINNLKFGKKHQLIVDTVYSETDGQIILIKNTQSIVNIDFCYFTSEESFGGGDVHYDRYPNGTIKMFDGQNGGAIAQYGGDLNISNSTFARVEARVEYEYLGGNGGAIYQKSGSLSLINCTFYNNSTGYNGINRSNRKLGDGEAIYSENSTISITNCSFSENFIDGVALYPNIDQWTFAIYLINSNLEIKNSIFYHNQSNMDIHGNINSGGYNIFSQTYIKINGIVSSDIFDCNPGFILVKGGVVLSNSTFWIPICALDTPGCAVDALPVDGNGAPLCDQRGFTRINAPDIGAFEYNGGASN
jgi:hypothetical protein